MVKKLFSVLLAVPLALALAFSLASPANASTKARQTITFLETPPSAAPQGFILFLFATSSSGNPVQITTSGPCQTQPTFPFGFLGLVTDDSGTCTISATVAGDGRYRPASKIVKIAAKRPILVDSDDLFNLGGQALVGPYERYQAYQTKLEAFGAPGPFTFSIASGKLPAGLTLRPDGTIIGKPAYDPPRFGLGEGAATPEQIQEVLRRIVTIKVTNRDSSYLGLTRVLIADGSFFDLEPTSEVR